MFLIWSFIGLLLIPFHEAFSRMGVWARFIGFGAFFLYFGICNSELVGGETLGKRLSGLQVVDVKGKPITFARSLVRASILAIPGVFSGLPLFFGPTRLPLTIITGVIVFSTGIATVYLIVCNRPTRQGLHDLLVGSYVVSGYTEGVVDDRRVWLPHWAIIGVIVLLSEFLSMLGVIRLTNDLRWNELRRDILLTQNIDGVESAGALYERTANPADGKDKTTLVITVVSLGELENNDLADRVAASIVQHDADVSSYDSLKIVIATGYNLGMNVFYYSSENFERTPTEWKLSVGDMVVPARQ